MGQNTTYLAGSIPAPPTNEGSVLGTDVAGSKILTGSSPVLSTPGLASPLESYLETVRRSDANVS